MGKRLTIALAVFASLAVTLGAYVAGYFWLGVQRDLIHSVGYPKPGDPSVSTRIYPQRWMATAFHPAAKIEGWLRGIEAETDGGPLLFYGPNWESDD